MDGNNEKIFDFHASYIHVIRRVKQFPSLLKALMIADKEFRRKAIFAIVCLLFALIDAFYSILGNDSLYSKKFNIQFDNIAAVIAAAFAGVATLLAFIDYRSMKYGPGRTKWIVKNISAVERFGRSVSLASLTPSEGEANYGFKSVSDIEFCREHYLRSERYDNEIVLRKDWGYILGPSMKWKFFDSDETIRNKQIRYLVPRILNAELPTTNEEKCKFIMDYSFRELSVCKIGYYDSLITNEAFRGKRILVDTRTKYEEETIDLNDRFPIYQTGDEASSSIAHLCPLAETSNLGNHVGATAITITKDGRILIYCQHENMISPGALLLGGSGSVDWNDIKDSGNSGDFLTITKFGMAREFFEESGLYHRGFWASLRFWDKRAWKRKEVFKIAQNMIVTGYFRWISRCGKPELVGVARLDSSFQDLMRRQDGVEVVRFSRTEDLPKLTSLEDFLPLKKRLLAIIHELNERLPEGHKTYLGLSMVAALNRVIEIAGYKNSEDKLQRRVHDNVASTLFPRDGIH